MVEQLRRGMNMHKMGLKKSVRVKCWNEEESSKEGRVRKENRMPTVLKKNKVFIDRIDPTASNITH